ncbi:MAG: hypothetical protein WKH64_07780 [Chloroflexia bacterium]
MRPRPTRASPLAVARIEGAQAAALLLAFVDSLLGAPARALAMAQHACEAQESGSTLTEAVAHMRAGHAYQLLAHREAAARSHYTAALELARSAGVARTQAEAWMGLALLAGHAGDQGEAESAARAGLELVEAAGDQWLAGLLWLALGESAAAAGAEAGTLTTGTNAVSARGRHVRPGGGRAVVGPAASARHQPPPIRTCKLR